jgi:hypothetical protein
VQLYRDYVARFERADAEFQPIVREARTRMLALMPRE